MRCAIYARYSSDKQNDASIEDQIRLCQKYAARNNLEVVATFADHAKSGASILGRDGLMEMMVAAKSRAFDAILTESLDRLSRDQADLADMHKRLSFMGVDIVSVSSGKADIVEVGVRGMLGALYLRDLADKTRRGLAGKVASGMFAGGKAYGYSPVKGEPGVMQIVEPEAEIVRRIYSEYAAGKSGRHIARDLNKDGVPAPRGAAWAANTLTGGKTRGTGMLRLPIYVGKLVWNKVHYIKDPDTGKRVTRPNPPSEWQHADMPHLRIIDDELWNRVQERLSETGKTGGTLNRPRRRRMLSGLIKCAVCGSGMAVNGTTRGKLRVMCSKHRESASCDHGKSYYLHDIERAVADALRQVFADADAMQTFVETYAAERRRLVADIAKRRNRAEAELAKAKAAWDRVFNSYVEGIIDKESLLRQKPALDRRIALAEAELSRTAEPPKVDLHPEAVASYKRAIDELHAILASEAETDNEALMKRVRDIVHAVHVHPSEKNAPLHIEIIGKLSALTGDATLVVAGAGFEPAAFRL